MQNAKRNSNITESVWLHKEKYNKQMTSNFRFHKLIKIYYEIERTVGPQRDKNTD